MRDDRYGPDVLSRKPNRRAVPEVVAEPGLVVEDPASGFCGAVVRFEHGHVVLEDRHGRHRLFPLTPAGFLLDGKPVTLTRPAAAPATKATASASGLRTACTAARNVSAVRSSASVAFPHRASR